MKYYFITWWTFYSECWCNGLLKCVPFTYKNIFWVQIHFKTLFHCKRSSLILHNWWQACFACWSVNSSFNNNTPSYLRIWKSYNPKHCERSSESIPDDGLVKLLAAAPLPDTIQAIGVGAVGEDAKLALPGDFSMTISMQMPQMTSLLCW